jgi:hypothetical protein
MWAGLVTMAPVMFGAIEIDFSGTSTNPPGTISIASSNIVGSNIAMQIMQVNLGFGFTNYATSGSCAGFACLSFDANAGTINIVGGVPTLFAGSTALLTGTGDTITDAFSPSGSIIDVSATGPDSKSGTLLSALGLSPSFHFAIPFGFSMAAQEAGNSNTYDAYSTDITNSGIPDSTAIPEPNSIVLFGAVLVGCGMIRRRKTPIG